MRNIVRATALVLAASAFATTAQAVSEEDSWVKEVKFTMDVAQPMLFSPLGNEYDIYFGTLHDNSGRTLLEVVCSATTRLHPEAMRRDEACGVAGQHAVRNPQDVFGKLVRRADFDGGFTIRAHARGTASMDNVQVNYRAMGTARAVDTNFGGSMVVSMIAPDDTYLAAAKRLVRESGTTAEESQVNANNIDVVVINNMTIPDIGLARSEACQWTGNIIFVSVIKRYGADLQVTCGSKGYHLVGTISLDSASEGDHDLELHINLPLQVKRGDPFGTPETNGISGVLEVSNSGRVTPQGISEMAWFEGTIIGKEVPLEVPRGFAQIMTLLGRTFMINNHKPSS
jgi:hypothetical protein